jgi:cysteinyl-tRNA synthetase
MLKIYNTLTRKKEEFIPQGPAQVKMYTCGVTVYDDCHIGHARSLYIFDLMRRYLKYRGFEVKFVRNITDIDDKIINRANELKVNWQDLVKKYIERYYGDLKALGIDKADFEPRATENIPDMIKYIAALIDKGYAYRAGGDIYFSVRKFSAYGKLSGQNIEEMEKGVRIEPAQHKKDHLDFALWKASKEGEPFWDSPWGKGRPGWHIECSVMSQKLLKTDTLDIHAGGRDLVFPHHENELAQAESCTGKQFARYWIHHGLLTINGQKMAKSLGNFVTIKDFISKYKYPDILKLFFLSAHYAHPVDYNDKKIEEARQALQRITILFEKIEKMAMVYKSPPVRDKNKETENLRNKFIEAMNDDFNTPKGLAVIFDLITLTNKNIEDISFVTEAKSLLCELTGVLGLELKDIVVSPAKVRTEESIIKLINERNQARKNRDFKTADKIRKDLERQGIILEDNKDGTANWRKKL